MLTNKCEEIVLTAIVCWYVAANVRIAHENIVTLELDMIPWIAERADAIGLMLDTIHYFRIFSNLRDYIRYSQLGSCTLSIP